MVDFLALMSDYATLRAQARLSGTARTARN